MNIHHVEQQQAAVERLEMKDRDGHIEEQRIIQKLPLSDTFSSSDDEELVASAGNTTATTSGMSPSPPASPDGPCLRYSSSSQEEEATTRTMPLHLQSLSNIEKRSMTPTQLLECKFRDLETRWADQKSTSRKGRREKPNHTDPLVQIIGTPHNFDAASCSKRSVYTTGRIRQSSSSVFDRLYSDGKAKMTARRRREKNGLYHSSSSRSLVTSPSVGGETSMTTVSSLGESSSVFDRLYNYKKTKKQDTRHTNKTWDAKARLERRLSYTPTTHGRKTKGNGETSSLTRRLFPKDEVETKHNDECSVFNRLYRNEKRKEKLYKTPKPKTRPSCIPDTNKTNCERLDTQMTKSGKHNVSAVLLDRAVRTIPRYVRRQRYVVQRNPSSSILIEILRRASARKIQRTIRTFLDDKHRQNTITRVCASPPGVSPRADVGLSDDCAATILQCAWRCHRSQIELASRCLQSWWIKFDFNQDEAFATKNRILLLKFGLQSLCKAIGNVNCWWITEHVRVEDQHVHCEWKREVWIHHAQSSGKKILSNCVVSVKNICKRTRVMKTWNRQKVAILVIKATLEKILQQHELSLRNTSALLIQTRFRIMLSKKERGRREEILTHHIKVGAHYIPAETNNIRAVQHGPSQATSTVTLQNRVELEPQVAAAVVLQFHARRLLLRQVPDGASALKSLNQHNKSEPNKQGDVVSSAIILQCEARVFLTLRRFQRQQSGAVLIQTSLRRFLTRRRFVAKQQARILMETVQREIDRRRRESIMIRDIVTVQSLWRRHHAQLVFRRSLSAVTLIQTHERRRAIRWKYSTLLRRFARLQALVRGFLVHRRLLCQTRCGVLIQRRWRGFRVRSSLESQRFSAVVLQSFVRQYLEYNAYRTACSSVIVLQRLLRGEISRRHLFRQHSAAVRIQSIWRRNKDLTEYREILHATAVIQLHWRAVLYSKKTNQIMSDAATFVQRNWRSYLLRKIFSERRSSAVVLQTLERGGAMKTRYTMMKCNFTLVQATVRGMQCRQKLLCEKECASAIQKLWRRAEKRKMLDLQQIGAVQIQSMFRRNASYNLYRRRMRGVVLFQSMYRGAKSRTEVGALNHAATRLQRAWRVSKATSMYRCLRDVLERRTLASRVIQSCWRTFVAYRRYKMMRDAATVVQCCWRRIRAMKLSETRRSSVILIQGCQRRFAAQTSYESLLRCSVRVQSFFRGRLSRKKFLSSKRSATMLQRIWRGFQTRRVLRKTKESAAEHRCHIDPSFHAASKVQAMFRMSIAKKRFQKIRAATKLIQKVYLRWKMDFTLLKVLSSTVLLHWSFKGLLEHSARRFALNHINGSVRSTVLSSFERIGMEDRWESTYVNCAWTKAIKTARVSACIIIQSATRGMIVRNRTKRRYLAPSGCRLRAVAPSSRSELNLLGGPRSKGADASKESHFVAAEIQRLWRGKRQRRLVEKHHKFATMLQTRFRCYVCAKAYRVGERGITLMQAMARGSACRLNFVRMRNAVLLLQLRWRESRKANKKRARLRTHFEARILAQAEEEARSDVKTLLVKDRSAIIQKSGPCMARMVQRLRQARTMAGLPVYPATSGSSDESKEITVPLPPPARVNSGALTSSENHVV